MSSINLPQLNNHKPGVKRMKRHTMKIDMTPMVDLGFLLITFFVMTVEMSKPSSIGLIMPKDGPDRTKLQQSAALTVLLGNENEIWYYHGDWNEALQQNKIHQTSFSSNGLGKIIREKQKVLDNTPAVYDGRDGLTILIKAASNANYEGVVDVLDETIINNVKRYALVNITEEERKFLSKQTPE